MIRGGDIARYARLFVHGPPVAPDVERAFAAHCDALMRRFVPWTLGFFVVVAVGWWPTDLIIYADEPEAQRWLARVRGAIAVNHLAWLTLGRGALRRHPVRWGVVIAFGEAWFAGWAAGHVGGFDSPWPYYIYIWPLVLVGLARPLSTRLPLIMALGLGALGCHVAASGTPLDHPDLAVTASYLVFCCAFATLVGHGMWLLVRENFVQRCLIDAQRARLDGFREVLEERVAAQTRDLQVLSRRIETLREQERGWMAGEMHDTLGQELTGARYALDLVRTRLSGDDGRLDAAIADIHGRLGLAQDSVTAILARLRPRVLDELGLAAALAWLASDTAARSGLTIECTARPPDARLPAALETALYRVSQEALSNVLRHAEADRAWIELVVGEGQCTLTVRDDGIGFDAAGGSGVGCIGIRERMAALGGRAVWSTPEGGGTALRVDAPWSS